MPFLETSGSDGLNDNKKVVKKLKYSENDWVKLSGTVACNTNTTCTCNDGGSLESVARFKENRRRQWLQIETSFWGRLDPMTVNL